METMSTSEAVAWIIAAAKENARLTMTRCTASWACTTQACAGR